MDIFQTRTQQSTSIEWCISVAPLIRLYPCKLVVNILFVYLDLVIVFVVFAFYNSLITHNYQKKDWEVIIA